jgi:hypothetical protein
MKHLSRLVVSSVAALVVTAGAVSLSAPAHADSSWGWGKAYATSGPAAR